MPPPRPTVWALLYVLAYVVTPLAGVIALLDLLLHLLVTGVLGRCYGTWCFLT